MKIGLTPIIACIVTLTALPVVACSEAAAPPSADAEALHTLAGDVETFAYATADDVQQAASVTRVDAWPEMNAKVFALSGGDRALNGEQVYLALLGHPLDGWRAYRLADVESYDIGDTAPGRITLLLREQTMDDEGAVVTRARSLVVSFDPDFDTAPESVRVAPLP